MTQCRDTRGIDKIYHIILGGFVCVVVGVLVAHFLPITPIGIAVVALSSVVVAAVAWEFYRKNKTNGNHICIWDILWTTAGGFAMVWLPWLNAYLLAVGH